MLLAVREKVIIVDLSVLEVDNGFMLRDFICRASLLGQEDSFVNHKKLSEKV